MVGGDAAAQDASEGAARESRLLLGCMELHSDMAATASSPPPLPHRLYSPELRQLPGRCEAPLLPASPLTAC